MNSLADIAAHSPFLLTATPLFGAVLVWINARRGIVAARQTALTNATLTLCVAVAMAWNFSAQPPSHDRFPIQMVSFIPWWQMPLSAIGSPASVRMALAFGVDGVSLMPMLIVALIGWGVVLTADRCSSHWSAKSYLGILLGQSLAMGLFAAQDFTWFLICCELWTWWAFFVIGRHGGTDRRQAAQRFVIISSAAHAAWGLAGIGTAVCQAWIQAEVRRQSAGVSLLYSDMIWAQARWIFGNHTAWEIWASFPAWVLPLWLIGLWLRWPLFPCHGWWMGLVKEARAPIAAFCGATSLLQGGYVLFRFVIPLFPPAGTVWPLILAGGAGFGVLYFGLLAVAQTEGRKLAGYLSLSAMHGGLLCGLSGRVGISLAGWQMMLTASLAVAAVWLLIGWYEQRYQTLEFREGSPAGGRRWLIGIGLAGGLLSIVPCFAALSGQVFVNLTELRRRGVPNLTLIAGSLLSAWALVRSLLAMSGSKPVEPAHDLRGRELLMAAPIVAALILGVAPGVWQQRLLPTWERLHDPFAASAAATSQSVSQPVRITAGKPAAAIKDAKRGEMTWLCAPLFWLICGAWLLLIPNGWLTDRWERTLAVLGLAGGLAAEWIGGEGTAGIPAWTSALLWSLTVIGVVRLTVTAESGPCSLLLRLSAMGWAAVTTDLLLAGLAWELAEFARWLSLSGQSATAHRSAREHLRHLISSVCFWFGVAGSAWLARTTSFQELATRLAAQLVRDDNGQVIGSAPVLGLMAAILLICAVGARCGLLPWSFGRRDSESERRCGPVLLNQWLDQLLGIILLMQIVPAFSVAYGGPIVILLSLAAAATALWSGLSIVGELKAMPILRGITTGQFAGIVLLIATLAGQSAAESTGFREQFDRLQWLNLLASWNLAISLAVCGVAAIITRLGEPAFGDLYLEHYRGLFAKRGWEAAVFVLLLAGLLSRWPLTGFWSNWIGQIGLAMTPLSSTDGHLQTHPVLLAALVICLLSSLLHLERVVNWISCLAFDPPVALPEGSRRGWDLAVALGIAGISLAAALSPGMWMSLIFENH